MGFFDHDRATPGIGDESAPPMLWYPRAAVSGCRLSLDRTRSVPTTDQTGKSLVYVVPHISDTIECWSGEDWVPRHVPYDLGSTQTRKVLQLDISACVDATNYDVYVRNVTGQWSIMYRAWPTTNRGTVPVHPDMHPDGLGVRDGRLVLGSWGGSVSDCQPSIDPTWLYLGTFRTSAAGQCEDSATKRFVWNMYNRVARPMRALDATDSWTYTTATIRQANANAANQIEFVRGLDLDSVRADIHVMVHNATNIYVSAGFGLDSTTTMDSTATKGGAAHSLTTTLDAHYSGFPGLGYHFLAWLEYSQAAGTTTWYGDNTTPTVLNSGITGEVLA